MAGAYDVPYWGTDINGEQQYFDTGGFRPIPTGSVPVDLRIGGNVPFRYNGRVYLHYAPGFTPSMSFNAIGSYEDGIPSFSQDIKLLDPGDGTRFGFFPGSTQGITAPDGEWQAKLTYITDTNGDTYVDLGPNPQFSGFQDSPDPGFPSGIAVAAGMVVGGVWGIVADISSAVAAAGDAAVEVGAAGDAVDAAATAAGSGVSGAVSGAVSAGDAAGVAVDSGVAGTVAGASAGAIDITSATTAPVDAAVVGAVGADEVASGSAITSILDTVHSIGDSVRDFLGPVADVVHDTADIVKTINEDLIKPIVGPITSIMDAYKALNEGLVRDLHSGVTGLLRIPQDISNALTTVDASLQRSLQQLGANNEKLAKDVLVPGMRNAGIGAVDQAGASITGGMDARNANERDAFVKAVREPPDLEFIEGGVDRIIAWFDENAPWVSGVAAGLIDTMMSSWLLISYLEAKKDFFAQEGRKKWPTTELESAALTMARRRGIITDELYREQMGRLGFNEDRIQILVDLDRQLPGVQDAINWRYLGLIDQEQALNILLANGWRGDDADRILAASHRYPEPAQALDLYHRGLLGDAELRLMLTAFGFREQDQDRMIAGSLRLLGPVDVFAYVDRLGVKDANVAPNAIGGEVDEAIVAVLRQNGFDRGAIQQLWSNHWQLLSPGLASIAYFRGYINLPQLKALYTAAGIPDELHQNFLDLQRPMIPGRSVPSFLAAGIISEGEAIDLLRAQGYSDTNAQRIIRLGRSREKAPPVAHLEDLHGLTVNTVQALYSAGTVTHDQALALLKRLDVDPEAAQLNLQLIDVRAHAAERKAAIELVVQSELTGKITFDEAQGQLHELAVTDVELAQATKAMERGKLVRHKLPSEAQVMAMRKKDIIDDATALDTLGRLGYDATWSERLLQLARGPADGSETTP